jgi:hypothetical protein
VTERRQNATSVAVSASGSARGATGESGPTSASPSAPTSAAPTTSASWSGQLAAGDPEAQDRGEVGGVGVAEDEPLGLDGGVDGLGEQRPGLTAGAQRAAGEGLDRGLEARGRGVLAVAGLFGGAPRGVHLPLRDGPEDLGEQLGLRREVAVDRAGRDPGPRGDRGDLRLPVAAVGDELAGGGDDSLTRRRALALGAGGRAVGHRPA